VLNLRQSPIRRTEVETDGATTDKVIFEETIVFLSYFKDLEDLHQLGRISFPHDEILLLCLLAVLAGAESFTEIALFGVNKLGLFRRFRPFKCRTPVQNHLGDILTTLSPEQLEVCIVA